jgi:Tol biopolymer transport system component
MKRTIVVGLLPLALVAGSMTVAVPGYAAGVTHATAQQRTQALRSADSPRLAALRANHRSTAGPTGSRTAGALVPRQTKAFVASLAMTPTLVFTRYSSDGLNTGLQSKNLLTGAISTLINLNSDVCPISPRLSPDLTEVVFVDYGTNCLTAGSVDVLDIASATITTLVTAAAQTYVTLPNFSTDGGKILYTLEQDDVNGNFVGASLFTVPTGGGSPTVVGGGGAAAYDGVYSPDGNKIVYAPTDNPNDNFLSVMNANGTGSTELTHTALSGTGFSPVHPSWSPDGTQVSFTYVKATVTDHGITSYFNGIGTAKVDDSAGGGLLVTSSSTYSAFYSSWSADSTEIFYDALLRNTTTGDNTTNAVEYVTDAVGHRRSTVVTSPSDAYDGVAFGGNSPDVGSASSYNPIAPVRVLAKTSVGPGAVRDVQIAGTGLPAPAGATAVTVNLTGVTPTATTYLQVYPKPATSAFPLVSNLNLVPGQISAVAVQVALSSDGSIRIRNNAGTTGVIVDVSGYFTGGRGAQLYTPITPVRAKDTTLGVGGTTAVTVTGLGAPNAGFVPVAVVLNLTGANPTANTYLSAYPTPAVVTPPPTVSNVNLSAHTIRANLVTVPIGNAGQVTIRNAFGSMRTIVDVVGYYGTNGALPGLAYFPLQPTRVMDTRVGTGTYVGSANPLGAGATIPVDMRGSATTSSGMITVPSTALAYVYNLTAVTPTASTYITAYPFGSTRPLSSSLNAAPHTTVPNLAITGTDSSGNIGLFNSAGNTPLLIDLAGYYAP